MTDVSAGFSRQGLFVGVPAGIFRLVDIEEERRVPYPPPLCHHYNNNSTLLLEEGADKWLRPTAHVRKTNVATKTHTNMGQRQKQINPTVLKELGDGTAEAVGTEAYYQTTETEYP